MSTRSNRMRALAASAQVAAIVVGAAQPAWSQSPPPPAPNHIAVAERFPIDPMFDGHFPHVLPVLDLNNDQPEETSAPTAQPDWLVTDGICRIEAIAKSFTFPGYPETPAHQLWKFEASGGPENGTYLVSTSGGVHEPWAPAVAWDFDGDGQVDVAHFWFGAAGGLSGDRPKIVVRNGDTGAIERVIDIATWWNTDGPGGGPTWSNAPSNGIGQMILAHTDSNATYPFIVAVNNKYCTSAAVWNPAATPGQELVWSRTFTGVGAARDQGHKVYAYDVDHDNRDDVVLGRTILSGLTGQTILDLTALLTNSQGHADGFVFGQIDPSTEEDEIVIVGEGDAYLIRVNLPVPNQTLLTYTILKNLGAGTTIIGPQRVTMGEYDSQSEGLEFIVDEEGGGSSRSRMFHATGTVYGTGNFKWGMHRPMDWDGWRAGDPANGVYAATEISLNNPHESQNERGWVEAGNFNNQSIGADLVNNTTPNGLSRYAWFDPFYDFSSPSSTAAKWTHCTMPFDCRGDWREELVTWTDSEVVIGANTDSLTAPGMPLLQQHWRYWLKYSGWLPTRGEQYFPYHKAVPPMLPNPGGGGHTWNPVH